MAKRCTKGKSCGATCIDARERCELELGPLVSPSLSKVTNMLESRKGGTTTGAAISSAPLTQPTPTRDSLPEYWKERADMGERKYDSKVEKNSVTHTGDRPPALTEKMKPYTRLSSDEKASVQMYGAAGGKEELYGDLNMKLRTGQSPPDDKKEAVSFVEQNLTKALAKLPDSPGEYNRAVSGGGAQALSGIKPGDIIEDKGFGSYSNRGGSDISPFLSRNTDNIVMNVNAKRFKNISPVTPYDEGEHLSTPGTKLQLTRIDPKGTWSRKLNDYVPTYFFEEVQ